jgi:hypothetical protein
MNLDVRIPIGLMFSILGVLVTGYGIATLGEPGSQPTGLPVDIVWGIVMLIFGVGMLVLFRRSHAPTVRGEPEGGEPPPH